MPSKNDITHIPAKQLDIYVWLETNRCFIQIETKRVISKNTLSKLFEIVGYPQEKIEQYYGIKDFVVGKEVKDKKQFNKLVKQLKKFD